MIEIISIFLNAVLGSGFLISLISLGREKKKNRAEAYKSEVDLVTSSVTSMIDSQKTLMEHNQELIKALTIARQENSQLSKKIDDLEKKITVMLSTNREIVKVLKRLGIDDSILKKLQSNE